MQVAMSAVTLILQQQKRKVVKLPVDVAKEGVSLRGGLGREGEREGERGGERD